MMTVIENLLMPSTPSHPTNGKRGKSNGLQFYPGDAQKFLKWGSIGFVGFGLYQMAITLAKRNVNPSVDFKDPVEAMNTDPIIRDAFIQLQNYRELDVWLYKTSLQSVDNLLFLEHALLSQRVHPVQRDKALSFTYFRVGLNRLNQFQHLVRTEMGNEHGMTVNLLVKRIYTQMQKHLLNILHLCSEFRPENLIARAPLEVAAVLRRMDEGRAPEDTLARWNELRGRLDREEARYDRRHRRHKHRGHRCRHRHSSESDDSSSQPADNPSSEAADPVVPVRDDPLPAPSPSS